MTFANSGLRIALSLLPVFSFLIALMLLDSFKLVRLRTVSLIIVTGGAAAVASLFVNNFIEASAGVDPMTLSRYIAPVVEELLKGAVIIVLFARHRIAFLVDAAILGFAVGAGFAAIENLHYVVVLDDPNLALWIVRGFGTALMHGSVTATMAIIARQFLDQRDSFQLVIFVPALALAVALHSMFNHFFVAPTVSTALLLVAMPAFFVIVFHVSELRTREWLGTGFDTDAELLNVITSGEASESRIGAYLQELRARFPPTTVVDMICLLRLRLELSIRAKGILLARQAGFEVPADPDMEGRFVELRYLEDTIGRTGLLALSPLFHFSDRDLWQYHMIGKK